MAEDSWLDSAAVRDGLSRLGPVLEEAVAAPHPFLQDVTHYLIRLGGKRLRPALLFLVRGGLPDENALRAAAAVELIHLASLHHDDVMDRAARRRGAASVNARWGNSVAGLSGTFLFSRAELLLTSLGDEVIRYANGAASRLCLGQLREAENAFNTALSIAEHLEIAKLKTATLFELAAWLGSRLGGSPAQVTEALVTYAGHLGLAFQIYDDVLDIASQPETLGKQTGSDIKIGVYSLPFLHLLDQGDASSTHLRQILRKRHLANEDLDQALQLVQNGDHLNFALASARGQAELASRALNPLGTHPMRPPLASLADYAVTRSF